ncbi:ABC transporter ATP-binding protein [Kibdelosporangium aridum]|uniref:ATP-binding cassette, subfamily B n=1 Tax=Kibdelosporangium aridum TaxID=2030 RepID=A0A1Y5X6N2_KIBAR|nr:ABC transporter ATP-binding protein [Kibdelosporangium aridum]SMC73856.1 ATP-binding cassette, subfamily B [Kibdelosporangium aridum]
MGLAKPGLNKSLAELLRPVRGRLVIAVACQAIAAAVGVVPFIAVAELGRFLFTGGNAWIPAIVGAAAVAVRFALTLLAGALSHFADNDFQLHVRRQLALRLGRLPLGWFSERNSGLVRKTVSDDVQAMHHMVSHTLLDLTTAIVTPIVALAYLLSIDGVMTLVTLLPLGIGLWLYARSMAGYTEGMATFAAAMGKISAGAIEFVQGIAVVKTFGQTGRAHQRYADAADEFADFFVTWIRRVSKLSALSAVALSPVSVLFTVLAGGTALVAAGWLAPLDLVPFALLGLAITAPVQTLSQGSQALRTARQAAADVTGLLETSELPRPTTPGSTSDSTVVFEAVRFSYDRTEVLKGIDVELRPGTVTALVGPSGAGKSTMAALLPRFHDVDDGRITIGGTDIRELTEQQLYRLVGFVFQDVRLLNASVRDNIALAVPGASLEDIQRAATAAQIHDKIMTLPRGYDSVVGEDAQFSGGEAQRVSIARAILADAPILVLDEATAFADPESEAAVRHALATLMRDRTVLVIAHRLSTVTTADQILVLDKGVVVERGTHADLVESGGKYAAMWRSQPEVQGASA